MRTLKDGLYKWSKKNHVLNDKYRNEKEAVKPKRKREELIDDLHELMGIYRPIYSRIRGRAYRQK